MRRKKRKGSDAAERVERAGRWGSEESDDEGEGGCERGCEGAKRDVSSKGGVSVWTKSTPCVECTVRNAGVEDTYALAAREPGQDHVLGVAGPGDHEGAVPGDELRKRK